MSSISESLQEGLEHHRAGRLQQAELMYRRVLQIHPRHAGAVHLLGLLAFQHGKYAVAEQLLGQAVQIDGFHAPYSADLGEVYRVLGKIPEAIAAYRKALALNPEMAEAQFNLGTLLETAANMEEAEACFREALILEPRHPEAAARLGLVLHGRGQLPEAQAAFEQAVQIAPDNAQVYVDYGKCLHAQGNLLGAIACYQRAARIDPLSQLAYYQLGRAQQALGDLDEAANYYLQALRLAPQFAEAHYNLAVVRRKQGRTNEAIAGFQEAARCKPAMLDAHLSLANLYASLERPDEAAAASRVAVGLQPDSASAAAHLAAAAQAQGDLEVALDSFRRTVELKPDDAQAHSNLVYALNYHPAYAAEQVFAEHRAWAQRHADPLTAQAAAHTNDPRPDRRLRIGYVSSHFREHAVSFFSLPMLAAHDHGQFEVYCYADSSDTDAVTARFQQAADVWRPVAGMSHEAVAELVRQDQIDILVDLAGHIGGNRLLVFARKAAPIQVTYLGYQNTTGMSAMNYRLTDKQADPPGTTDAYYTEKLVRLPRSFFCYKPPQPSPDVNELPALTAGHVTLGWLNFVAKTTPEAIETWARILTALPDARLIVLAYRGGVFENRVRAVMTAEGVDPRRVEVVNWCLPDEYLRLHHRIDIALDSFPFNGHTTICNALWMGVPSVVREGTTYASRFGSSALVNLGLTDLIARSGEEYVQVAARLAGDLPRLADLRRTLRARLADSPLLDAAGFTRSVEHAYRGMWQQWCRRA